MDPTTPRRIGPYRIVRRLGQGGMAEVFLARQLGLQGFEKYVVLKKDLPQFAGSQHFIDMLFALCEAGVEFLVVGAHALAAHGAPRATGDLDIWIRATPENARVS